MKLPGYLLFFLILCSCTSSDVTDDSAKPEISQITVPCKEGGEPNLYASDKGDIYLSWIEYADDTTSTLMFSVLENNQWSEPKSISSGKDWFVNWADFPSLVTYQNDNNSMAAHWLQKSAEGTFDYDVRISQSLDGGKTWGKSFVLHRDGVAAEHGFVSMIPISQDRIFATWLDGRNTKGSGVEEDSHGHHGTMTLRAAEFDKEGNLYNEAELDDRVCDCCQTSATLTENGVVVVYRDRSMDEIRDISIVRRVEGKWTKPKSVFDDSWNIAGCPVNGPVVKAEGALVCAAWYTMADGKPEVKVSFSQDWGKEFDHPIRIDHGDPLGRIDMAAIGSGEFLVTWIEQQNEGDDSRILAQRVDMEGVIGESFQIAPTSSTRSSGFPVIAYAEDVAYAAWTHFDSLTSVRSASISLP